MQDYLKSKKSKREEVKQTGRDSPDFTGNTNEKQKGYQIGFVPFKPAAERSTEGNKSFSDSVKASQKSEENFKSLAFKKGNIV